MERNQRRALPEENGCLKETKWIEVVSKPQIRFKGKASRALEAERTRQYVSISIRGTTRPLGLRWGFDTTSKKAS